MYSTVIQTQKNSAVLLTKMNSKAFELAISTLILFVIGVLVLIALVIALTGGFNRLTSTTNPYLDTTEAIAIKQACDLACEGEAGFTFCCEERTINGKTLTCQDSKLQVNCANINCGEVDC